MAWRSWAVHVIVLVEAETEDQARGTVEVSLANEFGRDYEVTRVEP